jgi:hypothetical protein
MRGDFPNDCQRQAPERKKSNAEGLGLINLLQSGERGKAPERNEQLESSESKAQPSDRNGSREQFANSVHKFIDSLTKSLAAKAGESYFDVLERTFPKMKPNDLQVLAHDVGLLNNRRPLEAGQQFDILGEYGKKLLQTQLLADYDKGRGEPVEGRSRSKFSPVYDQAMKTFGERIKRAAESELLVTRSEPGMRPPARPATNSQSIR